MNENNEDVPRVIATPAAIALIDTLTAQHGAVLFHQSGGCCDGSAPMCFPAGEFIVGGSDGSSENMPPLPGTQS